jgi:hypothetical protein
MCGACGETGAFDWARPFLAGLPARGAVAAAVLRLANRPGLRVTAHGSGWLVSAPTGATTACSGLTELVAAVRPRMAADGEFSAGQPSGRVTVPRPDARRGVILRVDPGAQPSSLACLLGGSASPTEAVVPDAAAALEVLSSLACPPWSLHCFLADLSGVDAEWGRSPALIGVDGPEYASDLVVWLESARQSGALDRAAIVARCPLDAACDLDVEIRAGEVVRARIVSQEASAVAFRAFGAAPVKSRLA